MYFLEIFDDHISSVGGEAIVVLTRYMEDKFQAFRIFAFRDSANLSDIDASLVL